MLYVLKKEYVLIENKNIINIINEKDITIIMSYVVLFNILEK